MTPEREESSRRRAYPPVRKSLGQHFLTDPRILSRIADALELTGTETVIEIGPGRGALTELLVRRAGRVVAIEYDRVLAEMLRERYASSPLVEVLAADVLETDFVALARGEPFVLAGNVPYYITTPILFKGLALPRPERSVYLVQKEVADRLVAPPGTRQYGALTVNVHAVATAERIGRVPAGAFHPPPRVDSAIVRIRTRADPVVRPDEEEPFRTLVQRAFGMRRKQMRRVVRSLFDVDAGTAERGLAAAGVEPEVRPETLSPGDFAALMRAFA